MNPSTYSKRSSTALLVLACVALVTLRLRSPFEPGDDAWMTFRVIRNISQGLGFVYNPGEYIYVTTTALFAGLMAAVCHITGLPPEVAVQRVLFPLDVANFILLALLAIRTIPNTIVAVGATLFSVFSWDGAMSSSLGMETSLFVFLILSSVLVCSDLSTTRRQVLGGILLGLTALTRPEGALLVLSAIIFYLLQRSEKSGSATLRSFLPWALIGAVITIVVPWLVYATLVLGSPLPVSIRAKSIAYFRLPFEAVGEIMRRFVLLFYPAQPAGIVWYIPFVFLMLLFLLGFYRLLKSRSEAMILLTFNLLFILGYTISNPLLFDWYLVPLEPGYILAIATGISLVIERIRNRSFLLSQSATGVFLLWGASMSLVFGIPGISAGSSKAFALAHGYEPRVNTFRRQLLPMEEREHIYRDIALELEPIITEKTVVMAPEFGAFGYYSKARIISPIGHISPEALPFQPVPFEQLESNNAIPLAAVQALLPDFILSFNFFYGKTLTPSEWFQTHYRLRKMVPSRFWGATGIYLFERVDPPITTLATHSADPLQAGKLE